MEKVEELEAKLIELRDQKNNLEDQIASLRKKSSIMCKEQSELRSQIQQEYLKKYKDKYISQTRHGVTHYYHIKGLEKGYFTTHCSFDDQLSFPRSFSAPVEESQIMTPEEWHAAKTECSNKMVAYIESL